VLQIGGPLTPMEFEHFVRRLLEARGLKGWTTDRSGDDGVDAVAINPDPMVGGLTIVLCSVTSGRLRQRSRRLISSSQSNAPGRTAAMISPYSEIRPMSRDRSGLRGEAHVVVWPSMKQTRS
jgi:Restriction endonuclease